MTTDDYALLRATLDEAAEQASEGKGRDRHASGEPFDRQPILTITRMVGPGFPLGQVMKKCQEAARMEERGQEAQARAEMLGAIVYAAAAVIAIDERCGDA